MEDKINMMIHTFVAVLHEVKMTKYVLSSILSKMGYKPEQIEGLIQKAADNASEEVMDAMKELTRNMVEEKEKTIKEQE